MDTVKVGYAFSGFRNDGRLFHGVVESVKDTPKGTRVVLHTVDASCQTVFKTLYLEQMDSVKCFETEHWPAGMTLAEYVASLDTVGA